MLHFRSLYRLAVVVPLGIGLLFAPGCATKTDPAWRTVRDAKVPGLGDPTRTHEYAEALHQQIEGRVESRIVRFRHEVPSRSGPQMVERSAVFFRSASDAQHPDWMMDNTMRTPLWLPNGTVERQLRFATRSSRVEVISISDQAVEAGGKAVVPLTEVMADGTYWNRRFEEVHGTAYDAGSGVDRRKMGALRRKGR